MYCGKCGRVVANGNGFCETCGAALIPASANPHLNSARAEAVRRTRAKLFVIIACGVVFIWGCIALDTPAIVVLSALLLLTCFAWDSARVQFQKKLLTAVAGLLLVIATQISSTALKSHQAAVATRQRAVAEAKQAELAKAEAAQKEKEFLALTSRQHLDAAKRLLKMGASQADIELAGRHLSMANAEDSIEAKRIKASFEVAQAKANQAAAAAKAEQAKKDAAAQAALNELLRISMAKTIENVFLDKGLNVDVNAVGPKHTTLRIKYIFVSKVFAHQMDKYPELFDNARKVGFTRIEATDGYDEVWTWKL